MYVCMYACVYRHTHMTKKQLTHTHTHTHTHITLKGGGKHKHSHITLFHLLVGKPKFSTLVEGFHGASVYLPLPFDN